MKDLQGREYAKLSEFKAGDIVTVDGDFDCLEPWSQHEVKGNNENELYIECSQGQHSFTGQLKNGYLIGIYKGTVIE